MNPFPAHAPVTGDDLCDREDLLAALVGRTRARRPVAVAGPPGAGITSLASETAARLRADGRGVLAVSLARLADPSELPSRLASAREASGSGDGVAAVLVDDADRLAAGGRSGEAREALARAGQGTQPLLFGHDGDALLALLGPGGDERLMEVGPLPYAAWLPYALERFLESDVWVSNDQVEAGHRATGGHARHLQDLFHEVWDVAGGTGGRVEEGMIDAALDRVLARCARGWRAVWDGLTPNQRRFLRGVARAGAEPHPFSASFLERSGLGTASSAQRAAASLEERGLLSRGAGGALRLTDPLLGRWLAGES